MTARPATATLIAVAALVGALLANSAPAGSQAPLTCNGLPATIVGTDGNDRLEGTPADDVIVGLAGRDVILGREGNDVVCGGPGNDVIKGGAGNDHLEGQGGNDKIIGGIGKDILRGGLAKDKLFGGGGGDIMDGGSKRDLLKGESGIDECSLDADDRFLTCETGDVVGVNGDVEGTFLVSVPDSFVAYEVGAGGGPQLQGLTPVVVFSYAIERPGEGTSTLTFYDSEGAILNSIGSVNNTFSGVSAIWGRPESVMIDSGGLPVAFDLAVLDPSLIQTLGPSLSGSASTVYRPGFPTDGPLTLDFTIGEDVRGSVAVFLYGPTGELTAPVFVSALRPEAPRQYSVPLQTPVRLIEIFANGSWTVAFT